MEQTIPAAGLEVQLPCFQRRDFEILLSDMGWAIGIDSDYPSELRRRLHAASASSVDHVLKRYLATEQFEETPRSRLDRKIEWFLTARLDALNKKLVELTQREAAPLGEVISEWTFLRVRFSFSLVMTCAQRGALFESVTLVRAILEQIAWAIDIRPLDNDAEIQARKASHAITALKRVHRSAGRFNGWLSAHAHWAYDAHIKAFDTSTDFIGIRLANCLFKAEALAAALVLFDIAEQAHGHVFEELGAPRTLDWAQALPFGTETSATASSLISEIRSLIPDHDDLQQLAQMVEPIRG